MILTSRAALRAFHGLSASPLCPKTGHLQPCLPLALAHAFDVRLQTHSSRTHRRHASRSVLPGLDPSKPATTPKTTDGFADHINPPESTLPATLSIPERADDQNAVSHWWNVGKAFWAFYKQGVKNIYANRNAAKTVRLKMIAFNTPTDSDAAPDTHRSDSRQPTDVLLMGLTRSEYLLERRSQAEMRRVPIFALILAVFGEWTPLIVMFATPIVPYNCRIPRQVHRSREKQEERRSRSFRGDVKDLSSPKERQPYVPSPSDAVHGKAEKDSGSELDVHSSVFLHICRTTNAYPSWMDWPLSQAGLGHFLSSVVLQPRRLSFRAFELLRRDDAYLLQPRGTILPKDIPSHLRDEEVLIAAEQRGIDVLNRSLSDVRHDLGSWLDITQRHSERIDTPGYHQDEMTIKRLLTRPNQWAELAKDLPGLSKSK